MKCFLFGFLLLFSTFLQAQIRGCTDSLATNYQPDATENDGSCVYEKTYIDYVQQKALPQKIKETSGLFLLNDSLATFNDDTDPNVYLFSRDYLVNDENYPRLSDSIPLPFSNYDWEEIQQDSDYLYVADMGNNWKGNRKDLRIYRIKKTDLRVKNPAVDTIQFRYELQSDFSVKKEDQTNFDAESFVVTKDKIYIFTKEWKTYQTSIYSLEKKSGKQVAKFIDKWNVHGLITGATLRENDNILALCGYDSLLHPFLYLFYDYPEDAFFKGNKRRLEIRAMGEQTEGITTRDGIIYYVSSEGNLLSFPAIKFYDLSAFLGDYLKKGNHVVQYREEDSGLDLYASDGLIDDSLFVKISAPFLLSDYLLVIKNEAGKVITREKLQGTTEILTFPKTFFKNGSYELLLQQKKRAEAKLKMNLQFYRL